LITTGKDNFTARKLKGLISPLLRLLVRRQIPVNVSSTSLTLCTAAVSLNGPIPCAGLFGAVNCISYCGVKAPSVVIACLNMTCCPSLCSAFLGVGMYIDYIFSV